MADEEFGHPRLAAIHDSLHPDRSDLDPYLGIAQECNARRVLDVGCGTGTFALLLADRGIDVVGRRPGPGLRRRGKGQARQRAGALDPR